MNGDEMQVMEPFNIQHIDNIQKKYFGLDSESWSALCNVPDTSSFCQSRVMSYG
jgi:hypothetical protein